MHTMVEIKVAVLNTSKEITEMLAEVLQGEGFVTCTMFTYKFKNHEKEFDTYIRENNPDVILYDIALPYEDNYSLFKKLVAREVVKDIPFVLTTTNKEVLESLVGKTWTHELVGKPYDLQEIVDAIKKANGKTGSKSSIKIA